MLLSAVLWTQEVWQWSALQMGLAILLGPALEPIGSSGAGKLIPKLEPCRVVNVGSLAFGLGVLWRSGRWPSNRTTTSSACSADVPDRVRMPDAVRALRR